MKYEIIHIDSFMYAVDDIPNVPYIGPYIIRWPSGKDELVNSNNSIANSRRNISYRVVTTNDPSLKLPLLPTVEEDVLLLGNNAYVKGCNGDLELNDYLSGFVDGYEAKSAKQFTEEQLMSFINNEDNHTEGELGNSCIDVQALKNYIKSLRPKPVAVELEMINQQKTINYHKDLWVDDYVPAVDENNFVKVKQWFF